MRELVAEFAANGFIVVPDALPQDELEAMNRAFDEELVCRPEMWIPMTRGRLDNPNVLLASTAFDGVILNPRLLPLVKALMGEDACLDEFFLMIRAPRQEPGDDPAWHRDMGHDPDHPLALLYLSIMYYLTDVDGSTHSFAIVPEHVEAKRLSPKSVDGTDGRDIFGRAGTAIVFNAGSTHTVILRSTTRERRTAQVYFGRAAHPCISNDTIVPDRFFRARQRSVRQLCARSNMVTQLVRQHC
jgi:hypothetical protein